MSSFRDERPKGGKTKWPASIWNWQDLTWCICEWFNWYNTWSIELFTWKHAHSMYTIPSIAGHDTVGVANILCFCDTKWSALRYTPQLSITEAWHGDKKPSKTESWHGEKTESITGINNESTLVTQTYYPEDERSDTKQPEQPQW